MFPDIVITVCWHRGVWYIPPAGEHTVSVPTLKWGSCLVVSCVLFQKMSACCSSCTAWRWWPWWLPRTRWHCDTPGQCRQSSTFQRQLCASLKLSSCSWAWASWLSKCGSADHCFENQSLLQSSDSRVLKGRYTGECGWVIVLWKGNFRAG